MDDFASGKNIYPGKWRAALVVKMGLLN